MYVVNFFNYESLEICFNQRMNQNKWTINYQEERNRFADTAVVYSKQHSFHLKAKFNCSISLFSPVNGSSSRKYLLALIVFVFVTLPKLNKTVLTEN